MQLYQVHEWIVEKIRLTRGDFNFIGEIVATRDEADIFIFSLNGS